MSRLLPPFLLYHFNGAAAFRLRKFGTALAPMLTGLVLQWGRSLSTAEITANDVFNTKRGKTSMGPQPFDCGNGAPCKSMRDIDLF